jgi:hypothetical protein
MHDTPPEIEHYILKLAAQRTPEERVAMAGQMFDTGVSLLQAGIRHRHPDISDDELRWEVFRQLYSDCYTDEELARIRLRLFAA